MKKALILLLILLFAFSLCGCSKKRIDNTAKPDASTTTPYKGEVQQAIDEIKIAWSDIYNSDYYGENGDYYLEIKNTRIITIKEDTIEEFENIDFLVEFVLFSNYANTTPYYTYQGISETVAFYRDGSVQVEARNPLDSYSVSTYSWDYSTIIDEVIDLGSAYNQAFQLTPSSKNDADDASLYAAPLSDSATVAIKDELGTVLLDETDIVKATLQKDDSGQYAVSLILTDNGQAAFADASTKNIGKTLALYVNGSLVMTPHISETIDSPEIAIFPSGDNHDAIQLYFQLTGHDIAE